MRLTFFTSVNNAYFSKAKLLSESVKRHHPDSKFVCLLVDEPPPNWKDLAPDFDELLVASDDLIPQFRKWVFQHTVVEACTGVKGPALKKLLNDETTDAVIYLDPDIYMYSPLVEVIEALEHFSVVLTPHFTSPALTPETIRANEYSALQHGTFNLGFVAVANRPEGHKFADWWAHRLQDHCFDEKTVGLFTDQRWVDLAPSYFPDLHILRQPGTNFATWNCENRHLGKDLEGNLTSNSEPLRFVHFSGLDSGAHELARERFAPNDLVFRELSEKYSDSLFNSTVKWVDQTPWVFGTNKFGDKIQSDWRRRFRDTPEMFSVFRDPFEIPGIQFAPIRTADPISRITREFGLSVGDWLDIVGTLSHNVDKQSPSDDDPMMMKIAEKELSGRPLVCHITHGLGGGVDMHVKELVKATSQHCDSLIVALVGHEGEKQIMRVIFSASNGGEVWKALWTMSSAEFISFLEKTRVGALHVHHTLNAHSFIATVLPELSLKVILTVHDHFLLTENWSYEFAKSGLSEHEDFRKWLVNEYESDEKRALETKAIFSSCSAVLYPSEFLRNNYDICIKTNKAIVAPHFESPRPEKMPVRQSHRLSQGQPIRRIAVLGDIGNHKGLQEIKSFALWLRASTSMIEIHHYGPSNPQLVGLVVEHGAYDREEIGTTMWSDQIDVVWMPNKAPESYSYVLSDVMRSMLPLLAYDVGALSERALGRLHTKLIDIASSNQELFDYFTSFQTMSETNSSISEPANSDFYMQEYLDLIQASRR
jgi:hypothetical protein